MIRTAALAAILGLCTAGCVAATSAGSGSVNAIAAALASPLRPAADTARDGARRPAEIVAFAGVKPGDTVAEILPGGGYYTRILAGAVGPQGRVFAIVSQAAAQRPGGLDAINAVAAAYPNVTVIPAALTAFTLPAQADLVWTTENYHDLHNGPTANPAAFNRAVFAALKPGGAYLVEDHNAPGTGLTATSTLHRIDAAAVIGEVTAAGFRLDGRSEALANPADPHTDKSTEGPLRGQTDRFALRFRKPG